MLTGAWRRGFDTWQAKTYGLGADVEGPARTSERIAEKLDRSILKHMDGQCKAKSCKAKHF